MEFWGVEVKSGEPVIVQPGEGMVVHLSQANIGDVKKDKSNESVFLYVNVDGKKMVLGTLFSDKLPQQQFDLVFDREFELSHNWMAGSVYFLGYKASNVEDDEGFDSESDDEEEEEDIPLFANNGKPEAKAKREKSASVENANTAKDSAASKQKVKIVEPNKDVKTEEDHDDSEDDDSDEDMDSDSDGDMEEGEDESDSELEDSDEDEETPEKVQSGKKRPASATKTPATDKKAKVATPQKTDGKKGCGHVATPHPAKQAGKTPANKASQQTPKSGGSFMCSSCKKSFGSDNALQSHTKAKHTAGK